MKGNIVHKTCCILLAAALITLGAGCASHSQQGAVSTSSKDWQKQPPSAGYLAFMKSHPMGPPPPPAAPGKSPGRPAPAASAHAGH